MVMSHLEAEQISAISQVARSYFLMVESAPPVMTKVSCIATQLMYELWPLGKIGNVILWKWC